VFFRKKDRGGKRRKDPSIKTQEDKEKGGGNESLQPFTTLYNSFQQTTNNKQQTRNKEPL